MIKTKLAHYEITGHLGTGGMGEVYQATDLKLGRSVAIKLLPKAFTDDHDRASRFEREARVLASLNHPSIAAIYGIEESGGRKFLVMELVTGDTLAEKINRGAIPHSRELWPHFSARSSFWTKRERAKKKAGSPQAPAFFF
jgi:serine/threonine protein kinase